MSEEVRYLLDGETAVETVYLADDAVEDFLDEGDAYDAAQAAHDIA